MPAGIEKICRHCKDKLSSLNWFPSFQKDYKYLCKSCAQKQNNSSAHREWERKYQKKHRKEINAHRNEKYHSDPLWRAYQLEKRRKADRKRKQMIIDHYGGKCVCCDEVLIEFLSIEHPNNDGASHRKRLREQGTTLYLWLIKNNFPEGYQVMCMNCNTSKGFYGYCPHQKSLLEGMHPNQSE